jgi:hypothetical protein
MRAPRLWPYANTLAMDIKTMPEMSANERAGEPRRAAIYAAKPYRPAQIFMTLSLNGNRQGLFPLYGEEVEEVPPFAPEGQIDRRKSFEVVNAE